MREPIAITSIASISALGKTQSDIWMQYQNDSHAIKLKKFDTSSAFVSEISEKDKEEIDALIKSDSKYKNLDASVLFAIYTSRKAIEKAGWDASDNFGINIGSSRGATSLFEKYHQSFLKYDFAETLTSPTTTLGNISSWVAHDLQTKGPEISHSITCSTALHSLLNGVAWMQSGMADKFLVGGSEAALTGFTIAQMRAMKIYASNEAEYPCRAFDLEKKENTMVIGEGASMACLEKGISENALAYIAGIGYATEILEHNISISTEADCFQRSMTMALGDTDPDEIDAIVMHAPGTIKGDISEFKAISTIFCNKTPFLTTNKWKLGHTFGASGMLSLELALFMLVHQQPVSVPFAMDQDQPKKLHKILVNAVGFGGNAVSVLLTR
ncbi:beta-ketoacyl synthase N-terminal-like domain-containing protein [Flavobacteriaceae bacterium S356]|uniref:Beta-ketoacyl synthase N-terminal-like domain-containing protein n=1 Tax=Asprobacillus argus TaxID=3076534 RepID=A0ABU3LCV9_9FLAO|nr:beta-ketoacyl synthase N-terminal-like domain-containing protein [Flavobacteriaceae bacterium S356]